MTRFVSSLLLFGAIAWLGWTLWPQLEPALRGRAPGAIGPRPSAGEWEPELPPQGGGRSKPQGPVQAGGWDPDGFRFHVDVPGWSADAYGDRPRPLPLDRVARAALEELRRRDLDYDDALGRAAEALAALEAGADVPLTGALSDFVLQRAGVVAPSVRRYLYFSSHADEEGFLTHLGDVLSRDAPDGKARRVGAGHADGARDPRFRHTYVILVATPKVALEPLPRRARPGETLHVAGELLGGLGSPRLLYLEPGGEVVTVSVAEEGRGGFRGAIPAPDTPGEVWIELLGEGDRGPEVAALFPVYVGAPPPDRFQGVAPPEEGAMGSPQALADLMYELVNVDRARFGLPALAREDALEAVALGHARDMRDHDFVAHVSPRTGSVGDRARAARYPNVALGENVARDDSVYSAEEALMRSLGHRENILSRRFTHVGIGVAIEERLSGGRALSIVQNFAVPAHREDPQIAAARVRDRLNRARTGRELSPLEREPGLERAARTALARLDAPDQVAAAVRRAVQSDRPPVGDIAIRTYILPALDSFEAPDAALEPAARWVGVAAAQQDRLDEDPRLWLVLLIAE